MNKVTELAILNITQRLGYLTKPLSRVWCLCWCVVDLNSYLGVFLLVSLVTSN